MKNKIGVIGLGVVGTAVYQGFLKLGHTVEGYDIKYKDTNIHGLLKTDIIFLCLPTKAKKDGSCDISIVEGVILELHKLNYNGIIAIKSTVNPGTTDTLIKKFNNNKICHVPEFLREKYALSDFLNNHNILVVGTENDEIYNFVKKIHQNLPKNSVKLKPTESELMKYFSNSYKAMKVTFANTYYEICKYFNINYDSVKDAFLLHDVKEKEYLDVNKKLRGFGGSCLPKDMSAINNFVKNNELDIDLFECIINENKKYT